eukprot:COSAG05_NODE_971_length_6368_cov_3.026320_6_plen_224_part_00
MCCARNSCALQWSARLACEENVCAWKYADGLTVPVNGSNCGAGCTTMPHNAPTPPPRPSTLADTTSTCDTAASHAVVDGAPHHFYAPTSRHKSTPMTITWMQRAGVGFKKRDVISIASSFRSMLSLGLLDLVDHWRFHRLENLLENSQAVDLSPSCIYSSRQPSLSIPSIKVFRNVCIPGTVLTTLREGSKTLYFGLKGCKIYACRMGHKLLLRANALACMFD